MMAERVETDDPQMQRAMPRARLFLSATIHFDRGSAAIRLRDLSTTGARIEGSLLPDVGATMQITRGSLQENGTVIWRNPKGCGVRFDKPVVLNDWMPGLVARDQNVVDEMVAAVRSGDPHELPFPSPLAPPPVPLNGMLPQRLAEELAYVGRLLESLGDDLCNEPLVVMRHAEKLQNLDISAQILGHVATVLVADQPERSIDSIGMTALRKRLQRTAL